MQAENRIVFVERNGYQDRVVLIKEHNNTVLMVRVREEYNESDAAAMFRAHDIADALTIQYRRPEREEDRE